MSFFNTMQKLAASSYDGPEENQQPGAAAEQEGVARLIANPHGEIVFINPEFITLCGYPEITGAQNIADIFFFEEIEQQIEEGQHTLTLRHSHKELFLQLNWVESQNGQLFLVASAEEITAREKLLQYVAEKIREKENKSSDQTPFIDLSFDACCITEGDGSFVTVNQNFVSLFGYSMEEMQGKTLIDLCHPSNKSSVLNIMQNLRQDGYENNMISMEVACQHKNGAFLWVEWNHKRVGDRIYSTGRDLTAIKSYRESLKKQEKKLAEAEAIGHIGQWRWPVGSDTIEFSDQLYKIFGLVKKSFKPTLESINDMIHEQDEGRMIQVFQRAIIEQNDYDMDFRITRADGEVRYIHCEGRCETDSDDDVIALYGIMQDVTDTTKRELDLRQAKDSVERAYAAKSQFLANMSHELRTPLNAIIGFSEMIERQLLGPIGTEKYLEYIKGIRESGEHLLDMISDILDMSKIEAGKYELHLEKFNIAKVIRMAAHMMEGRALDSDIKIKIDIKNEDLNVVADRRAIMQMVLNLLSNAVKFSKHGKTVHIRLNEREEYFSIRVEDEGIGIPANKLANITLPFEQAETDYTRQYEGSGLGLSITKELAEIHGGSLQIDSTVDVGTTVTIRLPYEVKK
ncbi:MAG TPA: PAS domain S-box protein [Alphaproteobacteria bacterium]|nr:PAS domain S-box protein [Alphaproteobacteria bacterium]